MNEKDFCFFLVINWKNSHTKTYTRKPKKLTSWEILVNVNLKVKMPEQKTLVANGEITIPETKVTDMIIEALDE